MRDSLRWCSIVLANHDIAFLASYEAAGGAFG